MFDTIWNKWTGVTPGGNCTFSATTRVEAYTTRIPALYSGTDILRRKDRITFCPYYFYFIKALPRNGEPTPIASTIRQGTPLAAFAKKAGEA